MHLVRLAGCSLICVAQTKQNYHRRSLSIKNDVFEANIEEKMTTIWGDTRQSDFATW